MALQTFASLTTPNLSPTFQRIPPVMTSIAHGVLALRSWTLGAPKIAILATQRTTFPAFPQIARANRTSHTFLSVPGFSRRTVVGRVHPCTLCKERYHIFVNCFTLHITTWSKSSCGHISRHTPHLQRSPNSHCIPEEVEDLIEQVWR